MVHLLEKMFLLKGYQILISDRIEFYLNHPQIAIDVTMMAPELPNSRNMGETAAHDSVDMFLRAFYQHGIKRKDFIYGRW